MHLIHKWTPPGYVLTRIGIQKYILPLFSKIKRIKFNEIQQLSGKVSEIICKNRKTNFSKIAEDYLERLNSKQVVVRSSHCYEDSKYHSYAGIFKSVVGVDRSDRKAFWKAVCDVAVSIYTNSATRYSGLVNQNDNIWPMSVIVQEMVHPILSGVVFTSIRKNNKNWFLLEYHFGGLDLLVGGLVTPQRVAIERSVFESASKKGNYDSFLLPHGLDQIISSKVINRLIRRVFEIEQKLNIPQDIEWAIDNEEKIHIFQTRPLTANMTT